MDNKDRDLIMQFEELIANNPGYWDFKESRKEHIHGIMTYPATMVPAMQAEILKIILNNYPQIETMLDPFMGSGTTLVEGMVNGIDVFGIDINPLSYLLSDVKCTRKNLNDLIKDKNKLFELINLNEKHSQLEFKDLTKWYKSDVAIQLTNIHFCIKKIANLQHRRFFWICLAEVSRLSNNSRNSTFKLHIKSQEDLDTFLYDVEAQFKKIVEQNILRIEEYQEVNNCKKPNYQIFLGDCCTILNKNFNDNSIDLVVTSPPYGDNQTTVTYGQFSVLPLRWIDRDDIVENLPSDLIDINSRIDTLSLGGKKYNNEYIELSNILSKSATLSDMYEALLVDDENKARKVVSFLIDFYNTFSELVRVVKDEGFLIFTVGNRRVCNREIYFNEVIKEFSQHLNVELVYEFNRNILCKRMPRKVSRLKDNKSVSSMSKEYILILKKKSN
ncbi:modification methylase [Turicibacter sanguinis]|uniref:DNA methyltransferase n=1 Tax=Turicibacter sanguinis TaxID=154288 RepID=UPI0012BC7196|nr:DNA methyltransferase [Turicibacter sanguinis]MCU7201595.1 site-specific DNA-methyltransferase [Turicibacter sanguinis]MTP79022.1 modification methylase [Turicibacter sanguinis]